MKHAIRSALFVLLVVWGYAQENVPASPDKPNSESPVVSPKATIPAGTIPKGEEEKKALTDPASLAANPQARSQDAALVDEKTYIIGAEDILQVLIWGDRSLSGQYIVRPDGRFGMQLVGEFAAMGKTPEQLGAVIAERLKSADILRSPLVTVQIIEVKSKSIYIIGEVNKPGKYSLVVPTTVLQALVNAGGFKDFANQKKITVQRGTQRLMFNYKEVINGKHTEQNILLQPEDHIIVK